MGGGPKGQSKENPENLKGKNIYCLSGKKTIGLFSGKFWKGMQKTFRGAFNSKNRHLFDFKLQFLQF